MSFPSSYYLAEARIQSKATMSKNQQNSLNSLVVALLAVAVIILAIKEPRCEETPSKDSGPIQQKDERVRQRSTQRELRKF